MIDTHTHIYFEDFDGENPDVVTRGLQAGVSHFILPNVDDSSLPLMKNLHKNYPEITSMAIGLHPTEVNPEWREIIYRMEEDLAINTFVAIGEVGIDLYWDKSLYELQHQAFELQLEIAKSANLPVIIHSRNAIKETLKAISNVSPSVPLIFHSFTGNLSDVRMIREVCNPYFGINGVITYKNAAELREALKEISLDRILLETDSPYLTPVPHRGKRNESSLLHFIRDKVADSLEVSSQQVESITDSNARKVFNL